MSVEQKKTVIDGVTYSVTQLDAVSALKIQTKLVKVLGGGIYGILENIDKVKSIEDASKLTGDILKAVIPAIANNFDDDTATQLVLSLFERNVFYDRVIEGQTVPTVLEFETYFIGKPQLMWKLALFILQVNFSMGELKGSNSHTIEEPAEMTPDSAS